MIKTTNEAAIRHAMEIAKTLCATPSNGIQIDKLGANDLADFIETLEDRFTQNVKNAD